MSTMINSGKELIRISPKDANKIEIFYNVGKNLDCPKWRFIYTKRVSGFDG